MKANFLEDSMLSSIFAATRMQSVRMNDTPQKELARSGTDADMISTLNLQSN
jgi:hypothetical protein